jgi:hypothetical protein
MSPEDTVLSDMSRTQKEKHCMITISLTYRTGKYQIHRNRIEWWLAGVGRWGMGNVVHKAQRYSYVG